MTLRRWLAFALFVGFVGVAFAATTTRHGLNYTSQETTNQVIDRLDRLVPPTKSGHPVGSAVFCGQLGNNTTTYLGPSFADGSSGGEGFANDAGGAICNGLDSTTEATADAPLFTNFGVYVTGMYCRAVADAGTTGSGSNGTTFNLRIAAAAVSPDLSCTVPTTGLDCYAAYDTDAQLPFIGPGVTADIRQIDTEDLSAMDGWCRVFFALP